MNVGTKEHYDMMDQFEKVAKELIYGHKVERAVNRETVGEFYYDGYVNTMFKAFMYGYAFHKCISNLEQ